MIPKRKVFMVSGTVLCALGTGFLMQSGQSGSRPPVAPKPTAIQQVVLEPRGASDVDDYAMFEVRDITLTSALPETSAPQPLFQPTLENIDARQGAYEAIGLPQAPADPEVPRLGCDVTAVASSEPMASARLTIDAPCYGNQRVTIHHAGLVFTEVTGEDGSVSVTVPALSSPAVFVAAFANGSGAVATTEVEDLGGYDRVALQWGGLAGFQIHALEFGAGYGEAGHVWSDGDAVGQGSMTRIGRDDTVGPLVAEIYTYPSARSERTGTVVLSVEAEVTARNCGRDITAQSLELRGDTPLRTRDLVMSMPDCDATGDFLVLNNLVEDLKIAAK